MKDWTGKRMRIIFDDMGKTMSKIGEVTFYDVVFIEIKTEKGIEIIPINKIIRAEVII